MSALDQSGPQPIGADFGFNPVSNLHGRSSITSSLAAGSSRKDKSSWRPFRSSRSRPGRSLNDAATAQEPLGREDSRRSHGTTSSSWWKVHFFRGMVNDIKRRAPFYWSDWTDAWDYRVVPATVYMYFAKCVLLLFLKFFFKSQMY
jgi:hypothetical protein